MATPSPSFAGESSTNEEKSAFVSGHSGTSLSEIFCILSVLPLTQLVHLALHRCHGLLQKNKLAMFLFDHVICSLPIILLSTTASSWIMTSVVAGYAGALALLYMYSGGKSYKQQVVSEAGGAEEVKTSYISNYKASVHLATAVCILAVDFPACPRRFAKAEVYGASPMDVMVGIMVFSMALTSSDAKYVKDDHQRSIFSRVNSFMLECHDTVRKTLPLLALGLARVVAVKQFGYHEHVTEYGMHWNFFIALAAVNLFSRPLIFLCRTAGNNRHSAYAGFSFATIASHQCLLSYFGLADIIQKGSQGDGGRDNFIDANREGLFSAVGYMAIYFAGVYCGRLSIKLTRTSLMRFMFAFSAICWGSLYFTQDARFKHLADTTEAGAFFQPVSRQMANFSYYLLVVGVNAQLIASFLLADSFSDTLAQKYQRPAGKNPSHTQSSFKASDLIRVPWLYESVSRYQLVYFLMANIGTAVVNIYLVDTLQAADVTAVLILNSHIVLINLVVYCVIRPYSKRAA